jgi:hypothetical protein
MSQPENRCLYRRSQRSALTGELIAARDYLACGLGRDAGRVPAARADYRVGVIECPRSGVSSSDQSMSGLEELCDLGPVDRLGIVDS